MKTFKKNNKLKILIIILILVFSLLLCMYGIHEIEGIRHNIHSMQIKDFGACKQSFDRLAEESIEIYESEKKNNVDLLSATLFENGDDLKIIYCTKFEEYEGSKKRFSQEKSAWEIARKALSERGHEYNQGLDSIYVTKDQVIFYTTTNYILIYTKHGNRPNVFETTLYVDRIGFNWFQAIPKKQ